MRAFGDLNLLVIGNFRLPKGEATWENPTGADGTVNNFRMYNIADCTRPVLRATIDLGANVYHEFYLWVDPKDHTRTLLYATFNDNNSGPNLPDLKVFDITNAQNGAAPSQIASFTLDPAVPADARVNTYDPEQKVGDDLFTFKAQGLPASIDAQSRFVCRYD